MNAAVERLEASRARLRAVMSPPPPSASDPPRPHVSWASRLGVLPVVKAVFESVDSWWANHPLRPVAGVAAEASNAIVQPLAQRNPFGLVLAAAAVGAAVAWSRPWRWMLRSALFAGLVPQLASRVVSSLPIESWMTMVGAALSQRPAASADGRAKGARPA